MAKHNEIGTLGESIAALWIERQGMVLVERNYRRKGGEIDIIYRDSNDLLHFVEVKAVSYETVIELKNAVSHGTYRPEENVHMQKRNRLRRAIELWLSEHKNNSEFVVDVITVKVVPREKYAEVLCIENILLDREVGD